MLELLPNELITYILEFLSIPDILKCRTTCHLFNVTSTVIQHKLKMAEEVKGLIEKHRYHKAIKILAYHDEF